MSQSVTDVNEIEDDFIDPIGVLIYAWARDILKGKKSELGRYSMHHVALELIKIHDMFQIVAGAGRWHEDDPTDWVVENLDSQDPVEYDTDNEHITTFRMERTSMDGLLRKSRELGYDDLKRVDQISETVHDLARFYDLLPDELDSALSVRDWKKEL